MTTLPRGYFTGSYDWNTAAHYLAMEVVNDLKAARANIDRSDKECGRDDTGGTIR
jgi:hypothetical protein